MFNIEKNHFNIHIMQVGPNISKKIVILTFRFRLRRLLYYNFSFIFVSLKCGIIIVM